MSRRYVSNPWAWALLAALGATACGDDTAPPDAYPTLTASGSPDDDDGDLPPADLIEKSELHGEWFVQSTVVDAPPIINSLFTSLQVTTAVVRWEVQEHFLVGYRAYDVVRGRDSSASTTSEDAPTTPVVGTETGELAPGTECFDASSDARLPCLASPSEGEPIGYAGREGVVCKDPTGAVVACFPYKGEPLFVYAIDEHVDLDASGDNVQSDSVRPWADRRFMRVDWSLNLASTPETSFTLQTGLTVDDDHILETSLVDEGSAEGPLRVRRDDAGHVDHISFVASVITKSEGLVLGELPAAPIYPYCLFEGSEDTPCEAVELHTRTTLRRAPLALEYEPTAHDLEEGNRFPLYSAHVRRYDPHRGELASDAEYRPFRFDLWESSWQRDASGSFARDAEGERIPLPFSQRRAREVRYFLTGAWPSSTIPYAEDAIAQWDGVLREAVAFRTERDVADVPSVMKLSFNGRKKAIASDGLEARCAELAATRGALPGQLSSGAPACLFVDYVPTEDEAWRGRAFEILDAPDTVVASVGDLEHHVLNWVDTDFLVQGLFGYGPVSFDPRTGEILQASSHLFGPTMDRRLQGIVDAINALNGFVDEAGLPPSADLMREGVRVAEPSDVSDRLPLAHRSMGLDDAAKALLGEGASQRLGALRQTGRAGLPMRDHGAEEVARVLGSEPAAMAAFAAWGAGADVLSEAARQADSAVEWTRRAERWRDAAGFEPCGSGSPFESTLEHVAARYADAPITDGDAAWTALRDELVGSVLLHEMGHNFGLRHNFQGSHDALNFRDDYWELRRESLRPADEVDTVEAFAAMSRETDTQRAEGMGAHASSSVMDYAATWVTASRLGRFDRAAVLHSYAEAAEVFDWDPSLLPADVVAGLRAERADPTVPSFAQRIHYTQVPYALGEGDLDAGLDRLRRRRLEPWEALRARLAAGDETAPLLVPYEACSDLWVEGVSGCHRDDRGADEYETARAIIDAEALSYLFDAFREQEFGFPYFYALRHLERMAKLQADYAHGLAEVVEGQRSPLGEAAWAAATAIGFDFAARLGTTPAYGSHTFLDGTYILASEEPGQADLDIAPGAGRRELDRYLDTGSPTGDSHLVEYGHAWMRWFSLRFLADRTPIAPLGTEHDLVVSYDLLFPEAVDDLLGGFFFYPADTAPRVAPDGILEYPDLKLGTVPEGVPVWPNVSFDQRRSVLVAAYGLLRDGRTLRFAERHGHVFLVGTSEEVEPGPGQISISYTDPSSGLTYGTLGSADAPQTGVAAKYMEIASIYEDAYSSLPEGDPLRASYAYALQVISSDMDFMRTLYRTFANVDGF